jgi:metallo-beta-lactamase class B
MAGKKPLLTFTLAAAAAIHSMAQAPKVWTPQELFQRNVGTREQQDKQFPPHKMIGNIYYVGTETLASFLIATPQGHIIINSMYERNVPTIKKSVEDLGLKFSDVRIILGSHAHADHMEADAMMKEMTGAQVMAMAEDVPALQAMKPGGKAHPIDKVLHDGDQVTLGGTTLIAHLTGGHTMGCTTWTIKAQESGRSYDVVIIGSVGVNPGMRLVGNAGYPTIAEDFMRSFKVLRALPADVPLGSHPGMFNMAAKHARLAAGGPNPYIDPQGYKAEIDLVEATFKSVLDEQRTTAVK